MAPSCCLTWKCPMRSIIDWLEHRTGIETAVKEFLYEEIPASGGYVGGWRRASADNDGLWPHVISAPLGQPRLLGNSRHSSNCRVSTRAWVLSDAIVGRLEWDRRGDVCPVLRSSRPVASTAH